MTNEQAEIQQAARAEFRRQLVTYMPDLKPHELDKLLDDARVSIGDWAKWHISQSEEERKRIQELERKLTTARLGIEWRDDVLGSWCDSVNDKRLADRRDKIQWEAFEKTNEFWEKDPSAFGLELSPYREEFLIQTDSYRELEKGIHRELDKLGVQKSGGSIIRIHDLHKRSEAEVSRLRGALERIRTRCHAAMPGGGMQQFNVQAVLEEIEAALSSPPASAEREVKG